MSRVISSLLNVAGSVAGPAVGGAVIALTGYAAPVYAFNVLALITCGVLIGLVRKTHSVAVRESFNPRTLMGGFSFVFSSKIILGTITLDLFAVLLGGATSLLPVYTKEILHVGPSSLGVLQAALPAKP